MYNDTELLSPAGTWESMLAAVRSGADAIYMGVSQFNARQNAENFNFETLTQAIRYCHTRGIKVYLTLNTLIFDSEINELLEVIVFSWNAGVDAIIVQDLGVAYLVKKLIPELSLHASTQMTIYNLEGVQVLRKMGFDRVVLAREMSLEEIKYICSETDTEIEIFVHGALCFCYSGQCLMSSMIGGRSGNRGICAQPCRLPYRLVKVGSGLSRDVSGSPNNEKYFLSLKDLSLIEYLDEIKKIGVKSLKIEGRLKRPEYVAVVTKLYRKYLDSGNKVDKEDIKKLLSVFNRSGFTQGYFKGEKGSGMISSDKPNHHGVYLGVVEGYDVAHKTLYLKLEDDLTVGDGVEVWCNNYRGENAVSKLYEMRADRKIVESAGKGQIVSFRIDGKISKGDKVYKTFDTRLDKEIKSFKSENIVFKGIQIYGDFTLIKDKPIILKVWDNEHNYVEVLGDILPQMAINKETDIETVSLHIKKTGSTIFDFVDVKYKVEKGLFVPISEINNVRRKALMQLEEKRATCNNVRGILLDEILCKARGLYTRQEQQRQEKGISISIQVENLEQAKSAVELLPERLYLPLNLFHEIDNKVELENIIRSCINTGIIVFCVMPDIYRMSDFESYHKAFQNIKAFSIEDLIIGNLSFIKIAQKYGSFNLYGDFSLNVTNSYSVICLRELGLRGITPSLELQLNKIKGLCSVGGIQKELIVYGRVPLMITENCIISECDSCTPACTSDCEYKLIDRKKFEFPVIRDKLFCRTKILNSVPLFLGDHIEDILAVGSDSLRLMFTVEEPKDVKEIASIYLNSIKDDTLINRVKESGFTRGHYFKGIK